MEMINVFIDPATGKKSLKPYTVLKVEKMVKFFRLPDECEFLVDFYPISRHIQQALPTIREMARQVELLAEGKKVTLWCRGSSGAIITGIMASYLPNARISHVKKDGESSHSVKVDIMAAGEINLIVDDFISSGETVRYIVEKMNEKNIKADGICVTNVVLFSELNFVPEYVIAHKCE